MRPLIGQVLKWRYVGALAGVLLLLFAGSVDAATVRGKITGFLHLRNPVWAEARSANSHSYTFREPSPTVKAELRQLFPYIPKELCVALFGVTPQGKMPPQVVQVGGGWTTPVTLVVTPGTEIRFKNTDPFPHRLFEVSKKTLNVGDTKAGGERIWTVPEAGVFEIRDELVPSLRMWIVADAKLVSRAFPDPSGAFSVPVEAAGEYTLQVFFAGKPIGPAVPATVAAPNAVLDLSGAPIVVAKPHQKSDAENQKGESD
jgi:hypothetical protein